MSDERTDEYQVSQAQETVYDKNGFEEPQFPANPAYPYDPMVGKYSFSMPPFIQPWEYNGWRKENMSWKKTCYISAQLIPNSVARITGPDAQRFLSDYTTNGYENFFVGRIKHVIVPDEQGRVQQHGMCVRISEDEWWTYSVSYWLTYYWMRNMDKYDINIEDISMDDFNFQCGGPRVLEMIEDAAEENIHDLPFMRWCAVTIAGVECKIMRFGMAGTLAYEIHGPMDMARVVYSKVYECGQKYGVERLGWLSYMSNHGENGFSQVDFHFVGAYVENEDFLQWLSEIGLDPEAWPLSNFYAGSSGTDDLTKRMRNPAWLGWQNSINLKEHDFIGKEAIAAELASPTYQTKTLIWNEEDLVTIFRSLFDKKNRPYKLLEFPMEDASREPNTTLFQDDVFDADGNLIGFSSGREYSEWSHDMFSLGCIKSEFAQDGTEVYVLYGEPTDRQIKVRATVSHFPHLEDNMPLNKDFDISSIPCAWEKKQDLAVLNRKA